MKYKSEIRARVFRKKKQGEKNYKQNQSLAIQTLCFATYFGADSDC